MKSKIALIFDKCRKAKRPALITYTVAGDNTKNNSLKILNKISKHADILIIVLLACGYAQLLLYVLINLSPNHQFCYRNMTTDFQNK